MTKRNVLVTGATGQQGGQVARNLIGNGHVVTALVRDPDSDRAKALSALGVRLAQGDFEDSTSLNSALSGKDSVFAVGTPFGGIEAEISQGKSLVNAAAEVGVSHFVYSSVAGADQNTGIPHFDSKGEIESHLKASGLNWTISAPVFFMDNVLFPWNIATLQNGVFRQALAPTTQLQMISAADIGKFNATVIAGGEKFYERRVEIAADQLSSTEMAAVLEKASGRHIVFEEQPIQEMRSQSDDMARMYEWFEKAGLSANIAALRAEFSDICWTDFSDWAGAVDWNGLLAA